MPASAPFACSPSIAKLSEALAKAQGEMRSIGKDKQADTGKYKYEYADLATVIEATRPVLSKHGLAVIQPPATPLISTPLAASVCIKTILLHSSGEWLCESLHVPVADQRDPQKLGSAISYGRRYAYCGIVGIATKGEDDDAQKARKAGANRAIRVRQSEGEREEEAASDPNDTRKITTVGRDGKGGGQLGRLRAIMREHGVDEKAFGAAVREAFGYGRWSDIEQRHYETVCAMAQSWHAEEPVEAP